MTRRVRALAATLALVLTLALAGLLVLPLPALAPSPGTAAPPARTAVQERPVRVLAISVDGLNPSALTRLGRARLPSFWRLVGEGAATFNARAQYELTTTLPNHTSMLTGRRVARRAGGHGVTWNDDRRGTTVHRAARQRVSSAFSVVRRSGGSTALFSTKAKFGIFDRSWPLGIDRTFIRSGADLSVVRAARADLVTRDRAFTFLHVGLVDRAGHAHGFMSPAYLRAVRRADALLGLLLAAIENRRLDDVIVVLTADHGGVGPHHRQAGRLGNYRIPFLAWGPGVEHGNLYRMNPAYVNPRRSRPRPVGRQPVRNGDLANLVTDLLGLPAVPRSRFDAGQRLRVLAR